MNAPEAFELTQVRFMRAPRDKVFDAFVDAQALRQWHCPRGMTVTDSRSDVRAGGEWALSMRSRDGSGHRVGGTYRELQRPARLVYTWQWLGDASPMPNVQTLVEIDLVERDGGTELTLRHTGFPAGAARDAHGVGWHSTLNRLVDHVDARGSAATLTLYGDVRSTYTRTVRMALAEKGVAYSMHTVAPHADDLLQLHPFGHLPALRDGETVLFESSAIMRYLDDGFGDGATLSPATLLGRARCEQWTSAIKDYVYDCMTRRYVRQYLFPTGADGQPDRAVIDGALRQMPAQLAALDRAYGAGDWLAGPALSMADLVLAPILAYVERMPEGPSLLAAAPNVRRAQAVMRERASFSSTDPSIPPATH